MKVPQYRSQTGLPQRTGAGQLTVQASPAAFGAVGAAQSELGQTIEKHGIAWTEAFLKTERATAQAEETRKMRERISVIDKSAREQSVDFWKDPLTNKHFTYFEYSGFLRKELERRTRLQLNGITDRVVRQRMASSMATANENAMTQINAVLRSKYMDFSKGKIEGELLAAAGAASLMKEGEAKKKVISDAIESAKYFHTLAPFIGTNYMRKQAENFESRLGEITIRQQLSKNLKSHQVEDWIRQIGSPKKGDEFHADVLRMKPQTRQKIIEQLHSRATRLLNKEQNDEMRGLRDDAWKKTRDQKTTHDALHNLITDGREDVAKGREPETPLPTSEEIQKADVNPAQKAALHQLLAGEDRVYNQSHVANLKRHIYDAVTSDDLDQIQDGFRNDRTKNYIGGEAFEELTKEVKAMRDNTPEAQERKQYHSLIKAAMQSRNLMTQRIIGHEQKAAAAGAGYAAIGGERFYFEQLGRGIRPAQAFLNVITAFQDDKAVVVKNEVKTLPRGFLPDEVVKDYRLMTPDHIDVAVEQLRKAARGEEIDLELLGKTPRELGTLQRAGSLKKSQRMTVRRLIALEARLDFLRTFAETNKPPPPPDGNGGGNEPDVKKTWFKKVIDDPGAAYDAAVDWMKSLGD